jgi:uncharacterized protein YegP (UPF0339 family)
VERTHEIQVFSRKPLIGRRQWHWRLVALANGKKVCGSLEGYNNRVDMIDTIRNIRTGLPDAQIVDVES